MGAKTDWNFYYQSFCGLQTQGEKITLKEFCSKNNIPYNQARNIFPKLKKNGTGNGTKRNARIIAIGGKKTIETGINHCQSKNVTINVTDGKSVTDKPNVTINPTEINTKFIDNLNQCKMTIETVISNISSLDAKDARMIIAAVKDAVDVHFKIQPELLKSDSETARMQLIDRCMSGELNALQAAMEFEKLGIPMPDYVRIVLGRTPPPAPPPDVDNPVFTEEQLEEVYQRTLQEVEQQRLEWVGKRAKEVEKLKDELKDKDQWGSSQ